MVSIEYTKAHDYLNSRLHDAGRLFYEVAKATAEGTADLGYCKMHFGPTVVVESKSATELQLVGFANKTEAAAHILRRWW